MLINVESGGTFKRKTSGTLWFRCCGSNRAFQFKVMESAPIGFMWSVFNVKSDLFFLVY